MVTKIIVGCNIRSVSLFVRRLYAFISQLIPVVPSLLDFLNTVKLRQ